MKWLERNRMRLVLFGVMAAMLIFGVHAEADFTLGEPTNLGPPVIRLVNAQSQGGRPVADAGLSRYAGPDPIVLDGTGSYDPDSSGPLNYAWQQITGPSVVITDANTSTPTISGFVQTNEIQECEFELVVWDGEMTSLPDTVKVIIVPDFGANKLIHLNPPFDPNKPTWIYIGGLGGATNVGSKPSWFLDYPEGYVGDVILYEKVNHIFFKQFYLSSVTIRQISDMFIVYLSSQAPDYKQPIQSHGGSAGGQPAIDIGIYLNETYADARYAVNRVSLFDATGWFFRDYSECIDRFLASAVDGEQCWIDSYQSTLPHHHSGKISVGFHPNVLTIWFDAANTSSNYSYLHALPDQFYGNSLINSNLQEFNHGVVAGPYWSVIGPGKNLQLASTPGVETYKFTWYGDASSGYMDFYDEPNHPGRLPEPVTLIGPEDGSSVDANGAILSCEVSENSIRYQLLFGSDPYHMVYLHTDTNTPPNEQVTVFPFEGTWWTVKAYDKYGSTIYADPISIIAENVIPQTIENITTTRQYSSIQQAINDALDGQEIVISPGIYQYLENINFKGKNLTVRSTDPNDPNVVAATVIKSVDHRPVATLSCGQGADSEIAGLTITGRTVGISCGDASPTIRNCTIESTGSIAIEFLFGYAPTIINCTILGSIMELYGSDYVAYWKLDETEGDVAYNSISENHGVLSGNPTWQPDSGQKGGALEFDGVDDYISTDFVLNPVDGSFSAFAWIKGGGPEQVALSQSDGVNWLLADLDGQLMTALRRGSSGSTLTSEYVITDGDWHHIGVVWDKSHRHLYADGIEVAEDTNNVGYLSSSNGSLCIGCGNSFETGTFFSGLIDDVRIYNKALTPEEIADLAQ